MAPTRRTDSAARLRALTRRAYTATSGHLDLDDDAGREFDRIVSGAGEEDHDDGVAPARGRRGGARAGPVRRWTVSGRAVVVVLAVVAAFAGAVVARAIALGPSDAVPVPQVSAVVDPGPTAGPTAPLDDTATAGEPEGGGEPSAGEAESPAAGGTTEPAGVVVVHVAGAVHEPGVVELAAGARVAEAVAAAGGEQADAELAAVNLARPLVDGEQVYVPRVGEAPPGAAGTGPAPDTTGGAPPPGEPAAEGGVVDLNAADLAALDTLPGVGPAIAQRILDWRDANGPFHSVEELLEVSGIGPATLEKLRERVRV